MQGTKRLVNSSDAIVVQIVRTIVSSPFSAPMPTLFPGALITKVTPYDNVEGMCAAF